MAALKYGATLFLVPFSFVYVSELLLRGTAAEIAFAAAAYLLGYLALAIAIQATEPVRGPIALPRRALFLAAAICLLFPTTIWIDLAGAALLVAAWAPTFVARRSPVPN